ncbi:MAG: 6-phosphofructokinase, partial [Oscillospiraceae bacterium]
MNKLKGACVVGQSGGPTSVINASAYGVISASLRCPDITEVYAAQN